MEEGAAAVWLGGEATPCLHEEEAPSAAIRRSSQARSFITEGCEMLLASDCSGLSWHAAATITGIGLYSSSLPPSPPDGGVPRSASRSTTRMDS